MVQVRVKEGHQSIVRTYSGVSFYRDTWRDIKDERLIKSLKEYDVLEFRSKSKEIIETVAETVKDTVKEVVGEVVDKITTKENKEKGEEIWTEEKLNKIDFRELKVIGATFNTTDRSKTVLIKEILKIQEDRIKKDNAPKEETKEDKTPETNIGELPKEESK